MKIKYKKVIMGEKVGPIDWGFHFDDYGWDQNGHLNPSSIRTIVKQLHGIEESLNG